MPENSRLTARPLRCEETERMGGREGGGGGGDVDLTMVVTPRSDIYMSG